LLKPRPGYPKVELRWNGAEELGSTKLRDPCKFGVFVNYKLIQSGRRRTTTIAHGDLITSTDVEAEAAPTGKTFPSRLLSLDDADCTDSMEVLV
jgi:hypothetical protein